MFLKKAIFLRVLKKLILKLIRIYQKTISPDHGPIARWLGQLGVVFAGTAAKCRFYPSCSEYAYQAIEKQGLMRGAAKGLWRILKCGPWTGGGYNPPV